MSDRTVRLHAPQIAPIGLGGPGSGRAEVTATLSGLLDHPPAVAVTTSCTHALEAAATLLEIGPGHEVVVPAFDFPSAANAFLLRGASVRFADVMPETGNIDPASVADCLGPRTRAVVCMHYAGMAADLDALCELGAGASWDLVEDAAHALFGSHRGTPLGRSGSLSAFSFHRTKNISSFDGGALVINVTNLADRFEAVLDKGTNRAAFESGAVQSYEWVAVGSAWRMSDPLVRILSEQLARRHLIQERRQHVWGLYREQLQGWAERTGTRLPTVPDGTTHPAHLFWLLLPAETDRRRFVEHCAAVGVETARHFGSLPASSYGRSMGEDPARYPVAAQFATRLVRLPLHHELDESSVERVVAAVTSFR